MYYLNELFIVLNYLTFFELVSIFERSKMTSLQFSEEMIEESVRR